MGVPAVTLWVTALAAAWAPTGAPSPHARSYGFLIEDSRPSLALKPRALHLSVLTGCLHRICGDQHPPGSTTYFDSEVKTSMAATAMDLRPALGIQFSPDAPGPGTLAGSETSFIANLSVCTLPDFGTSILHADAWDMDSCSQCSVPTRYDHVLDHSLVDSTPPVLFNPDWQISDFYANLSDHESATLMPSFEPCSLA